MNLIPLKATRLEANEALLPNLKNALEAANESLKPRDILVIASKVVAYSEGRLARVESEADFEDLVQAEADSALDAGMMTLTMKQHMLIPNSGIDASNVPEGQVVLWPEDSFKSARALRDAILKECDLEEFGVLISDSHCQPLRRGTSGIALGWAGFEGVVDERGKPDLFGRPMKYSQLAVADNLSTAANLLMGETDASIPYVIVRGFDAEFTDTEYTAKEAFMAPRDCIYSAVYKPEFLDL